MKTRSSYPRNYSSKAAAKTDGFTPDRLWLGIFGIWLILLSGILSGLAGSPGVLQAFQLKRLYDSKILEQDVLLAQTSKLQAEHDQLLESRAVQQREIRRVLGYAGEDELIFEFP